MTDRAPTTAEASIEDARRDPARAGKSGAGHRRNVSFKRSFDPTGVSISVAAVGLVATGLVLFGLDRAELSLIVGAFWGVLLFACLWRFPVSVNLFRIPSLQAISLLFVLLVGYVLTSIVAAFPGFGQTYWRWVGDHAGTLDRSATIIELVRLLVLAAVFLVGLILGGSDRRAQLTVQMLSGMGCLYAVFALIQHTAWPGFVLWVAKTSHQDRLSATFLSANVAAGVFGVLAMLMLSTIDARLLAVPGRTRRDAIFVAQYAGAAALLACLVMTASRSGTIAFLAALGLSVCLAIWKQPQDIKVARNQWTVYLVPAVLMVGLVLAAQLLMSRLSSLDPDWSGRRTLYAVHLQAFLRSPVTGGGLGGFATLNKLMVTSKTFADVWYINAAHNVYLQWLEETGVIGATLMFTIIGVILFEILRGLANRHGQRRLMRGVLAASAVLLIQGLADFSLQTPAITILWALILGLGFGVATGGTRGQARDAAPANRWLRSASIWAPRGVAAVVQVLALVVLWGLGARAAQDGYPLALSSAYAQAASDQLQRPYTSAEALKVQAELTKGLRQAPTDALLWLLDTQLNADRPEGLAAFARSYAASAIDPALMKWRTAFAAANWDRLTPDLRDKVMTEVEAVRDIWGAEPWFRSLLAHYQGTAFGAALALTLSTPTTPSH